MNKLRCIFCSVKSLNLIFKIRDEDVLSRIPALNTWFRTSRAVVMHLSNGTIQINFFKVLDAFNHPTLTLIHGTLPENTSGCRYKIERGGG